MRKAWIVALWGLLCTPWLAQANPLAFKIPAGPAQSALELFGKQSGLQVLYTQDTVTGRKTQAVEGQYEPPAALQRLLEGSGLTYRIANERAVTIVRLGPAASDKTSSSSESPDGQPSGQSRGSLQLAQTTPEQGAQDASVEQPEQAEEERQKEGLQEVLVTGTHIKGAVSVGAPIRTLDSREIAESGYTTTEQLLQSLPENFRGGAAGASADAFFSSGPNAGFNGTFGSGINLRGLGNAATLVLVNGHRVTPSGSGYFVDVSTIPISAIDHIDVLSDGASAVYGSDAVAGVVNIVLKKDTQGIEVGARYGASNGLSNYGADAQVGDHWGNGGFTFASDFAHQGILDAGNRAFTSTVGSPTTLLPSYDQTGLVLEGNQGIGDRVEVRGDAQYTGSTKTAYNSAEESAGVPTIANTPRVNRWSASFQASYRISDSWVLQYDIAGGVGVENMTVDYSGFLSQYSYVDKETSRLVDDTLGASGDLFSLPAGPIKSALGVSYRREGFSREERLTVLDIAANNDVSRSVKSTYGELLVPVFGESHTAPGIRRLTLSAAVRWDRYSDFGSTTNPKYGISWYPLEELEIRGAHSTSFRAPATGTELLDRQIGTQSVNVYSFLSTDRATQVPVVYLIGATPTLGPETADNTTVGFDYKPAQIPQFGLTFNYYAISYSQQIATPPFSTAALSTPSLAYVITKYPTNAALQAVVTSLIEAGAVYSDDTGGIFGPNPLATALYVDDGRIQNLSKTNTSGVDVGVRYAFLFSTDRIDTRLDATYIDQYSVRLTPSAPPFSEANSVGYPAKLRVRGQAIWTRGPISLAIAANYTGGYPDTSSASPREVTSFTTIDLVARFAMPDRAPSLLRGLVASLAATNIFDRSPPYVSDGVLGAFAGSHYDAANANPIGRAVEIQLSKHW